MSFSLVNLTGWTTGDQLTEDQINQLDQDHAAAVDGTNGGTYTLSSPLTFNGADVNFGSETLFNAPATFTDTVSISGVLTVGNTATFNGTSNFKNVNISGGSTLHLSPGNTLNADGDCFLGESAGGSVECMGSFTANEDAFFEDNASFNALATFNTTAEFNGNMSCAGTATFNGTSTFNGETHFTAPLNLDSGGYIPVRTKYVTSTLLTNPHPKDYDDYIVESSYNSANFISCSTSPTPKEGATIKFVSRCSNSNAPILSNIRIDNGESVCLRNSAGTTSVGGGAFILNVKRATVRYMSGIWNIIDWEAA